MVQEQRALCESVAAMESGVAAVARQIEGMSAADVVLLRLMTMVGAELLSGLDRSMRRHGLGETDFRALVMLFSRPDGRANPSELCGFDTHSRANMTRIGDALVARGLVTRAPAAEDRRRIVLSITPKGRRLVRTLIPQVAPLVSAVLGGLGQTQKRQLATTLKRIAVNIDAHAGGLSK